MHATYYLCTGALRVAQQHMSTHSPKCGTTWMQMLVLLLKFGGDASKVTALQQQAPWIEAMVSIALILASS